MKMTNPERDCRGGDVPGTTKTDNEWGVGSAIDVAEASFDPGYPLGASLEDETRADLKAGYCSYGVSVGDKRGPGYIGGR